MEIEIGTNLLVAIKNIVLGLVSVVAVAGLLRKINEPKYLHEVKAEKKGGGRHGDVKDSNSGRKKGKSNI